MSAMTAADILAEARRHADQIVTDARARAESLERDALERHRSAMGSLVESREDLDRRIDDLRGFEREYRYRLRANLTSLLEDLNSRDPREWPRQEMIGPEWTVIAPGIEVRATGNGMNGRVVIEIREATP